MGMTYADIAAYQALTQRASASAQATYNSAMAAGAGEDRALAQAKFEWQKKMDEAAQTGMWNGQWSNPQEQWFTGQFGQWFGPGGAPEAGQQTQAAQQQAFSQAQALGQMYGQYYAPGTTPIQAATTQAAQQQAISNAQAAANLTGYYSAPINTNVNPADFGLLSDADRQFWLQYNQNDPQKAAEAWAAGSSQALRGYASQYPDANQQMTQSMQQQQWSQGFQQQQFEAGQRQLAQSNALAYLGQLANLRGPADWAKYQQVLGSTPQGMRDLYAAAMGQYVPGGGATTGQQPQAADLYTMQQQIGGYNPQAQASGGQVWGSGIGVGGSQPTGDQAVQATGNGTNMYGGQQQQYNLPAPNQISSQAWNNFTPSQQQMLLGNYEAAGWDKNDVQALYNQSLPKYGSNNASAGTWRLQ
jgi:hypothetical protein